MSTFLFGGESEASSMENLSGPVAVPVLSPEDAEKANDEAWTQYALGLPKAVPVFTMEEAQKANKDALRQLNRRNIEKRLSEFVGSIKSRISILLVLIPLLLFADVILRKQCKRNYFSVQRRFYILSSVSLLFFGLIVFVPWNIYFGNSSQFPFIFSEFMNESLFALALYILGVTVVLLLVPPVISDYAVAAIAGLGLCIYVQSMFMNLYLDEMDGVKPEWNQHQLWGIINVIIWLVIISAPVVVKKVFRRHGSMAVTIACAAILLLELTASVSLIASAPRTVWARKKVYLCDASNQFQLSREKNIIVFVFDALGSGLVQYCLDSAPETKEMLKDFTWYVDARANYAQTFPGLTQELTGVYVHPAANKEQLQEKMWHSPAAKAFYEQIRTKGGFDSRLFISHPAALGDPIIYRDYFSNIFEADLSYTVVPGNLRQGLRKISLFSSVPYLFKKYFFYHYKSFDDTVKIVSKSQDDSFILPSGHNDSFYKGMISSGVTTDASSPVLAFYYTVGAHPPYYYDEKCNKVDSPFEDPLPTVKSCMLTLSKLIQFLKDNRIYDNTAILVCSDHGSFGSQHKTSFDMSLLIKGFNESNPSIVLNESRIQSIDVLPSLLQLACGDDADYGAFEGLPASRIPADRERFFYDLYLHPGLPTFYEDSESKIACPKYNSLKEYSSSSSNVSALSRTDTFSRFIPLRDNVKASDKVLKEFRP